MFIYTACWTILLAITVTIAALSLEVGFSRSLSPSMDIAQACSKELNKGTIACQQCFRLPLDGPRDQLCVPANLFQKTSMDFAVPPIFAGLVVAASALFVQGIGLWGYWKGVRPRIGLTLWRLRDGKLSKCLYLSSALITISPSPNRVPHYLCLAEALQP